MLLGTAGAVVSLAGVQALSGTVGPAFLALVLVVTVHPVQAWLQRRGAPSWVGALSVLLLVYAILLAALAALVYGVAQLSTLLPRYSDELSDLLQQGTGRLQDLGVGADQVDAALAQVNLTSLVGPVQQVLGSVASVLSDLAFLVTLVFFLALDSAGFPRRLRRTGTDRAHLVAALHGFAAGTRRYVGVATAFGLLVAALNVAQLYWLAVALPLLWGLWAFITNYIPNIGFVLGLVPPALLALLEAGPGRMLGVVALYSVTNLVIQSVIQPKVTGDSVGLSPTLTFLSLVFWSFVIGPLGALLAVPLSLLAKALLVDADPGSRWLEPLLGDDARGDAAPGEPQAGALGISNQSAT